MRPMFVMRVYIAMEAYKNSISSGVRQYSLVLCDYFLGDFCVFKFSHLFDFQVYRKVLAAMHQEAKARLQKPGFFPPLVNIAHHKLTE